jgi:hypothetical protein
MRFTRNTALTTQVAASGDGSSAIRGWSTSRSKGGLAALLTAAALIAPAAFAAPAHASRTESGCTVTPRKPVFTQKFTNDGRKKIEYKVDITCDGGRSVDVTQQRWEQDNYSADDLEGTTHYNDVHFNSRTTVTKSVVKALPTDGVGEGDNYAEVFQKVRFKVTSDDNPPVVSGLTAWDSSSVVSIHE